MRMTFNIYMCGEDLLRAVEDGALKINEYDLANKVIEIGETYRLNNHGDVYHWGRLDGLSFVARWHGERLRLLKWLEANGCG